MKERAILVGLHVTQAEKAVGEGNDEHLEGNRRRVWTWKKNSRVENMRFTSTTKKYLERGVKGLSLSQTLRGPGSKEKQKKLMGKKKKSERTEKKTNLMQLQSSTPGILRKCGGK